MKFENSKLKRQKSMSDDQEKRQAKEKLTNEEIMENASQIIIKLNIKKRINAKFMKTLF